MFTNNSATPIDDPEQLYKGDLKKGGKHGYGIFFYEDGSRYEGDWRNDERCGNGTMYYKNGNKYIGQWKDDKKTVQEQ